MTTIETHYEKSTCEIPNLSDVIKAEDIDSYGGQANIKYVNWCRTKHLLLTNAPGWQFHVVKNEDNDCVCRAPDGTGMIWAYFSGPNGQLTEHFPFPVMDNRNNPVAYDNISARDLTDTHRRCFCACAAFVFGLAWQLWAKEDVENPFREPTKTSTAAASSKAAAPVAASPSRPAPTRPAPVASGDGSESIQTKILSAYEEEFKMKSGEVKTRYVVEVDANDNQFTTLSRKMFDDEIVNAVGSEVTMFFTSKTFGQNTYYNVVKIEPVTPF